MKTATLTRADYEEFLDELGVPFADQESNGGRIPDDAKYGAWTRRNDPVAFNVGYREWVEMNAIRETHKARRAGA